MWLFGTIQACPAWLHALAATALARALAGLRIFRVHSNRPLAHCGCLAAVDRLLPPRSRGWTEDLCACFCAVARFASLPICPNMSNLPLRSLQLAQAPRWCDSHTPSLNLLGLGCVEHGAKARFFSCSVRLAALQQRGRGESIRTSKFLKLFRVICSTSDIYSLCIYIYIFIFIFIFIYMYMYMYIHI